MKKIIKPRGTGKTIELIKLSNELWNYIMCLDRKRADEVFAMANKLEIDIPNPFTFEEFINHKYGPYCRGFLFDDLDLILQRMTKIPINAITMTK